MTERAENKALFSFLPNALKIPRRSIRRAVPFQGFSPRSVALLLTKTADTARRVLVGFVTHGHGVRAEDQRFDGPDPQAEDCP